MCVGRRGTCLARWLILPSVSTRLPAAQVHPLLHGAGALAAATWRHPSPDLRRRQHPRQARPQHRAPPVRTFPAGGLIRALWVADRPTHAQTNTQTQGAERQPGQGTGDVREGRGGQGPHPLPEGRRHHARDGARAHEGAREGGRQGVEQARVSRLVSRRFADDGGLVYLCLYADRRCGRRACGTWWRPTRRTRSWRTCP